jgi:hypothetical protein
MQKKRRVFVNVYHGSYVEIKEIDLSKAKPGKDFGRGFYRENWIVRKTVAGNIRDAKKRDRNE